MSIGVYYAGKTGSIWTGSENFQSTAPASSELTNALCEEHRIIAAMPATHILPNRTTPYGNMKLRNGEAKKACLEGRLKEIELETGQAR